MKPGRGRLRRLSARLGPPLLFAALPVLTVASANPARVSLVDVLPVLGWAMAAVAGLWAALYVLSGRSSEASLLTIVVLVWVSAFGHVEDVMLAVFPRTPGTLQLVGAWSILGLWAAWVVHRRSDGELRPVLSVAAAVGAGAVVVALVPLARGAAAGLGADYSPFGERGGLAASPARAASGEKRDVYFIVPDRYASDDVLARYFDYDNRSFTDELRRRGFFVADASLANYLRTAHSLAAALNLEYVRRPSAAGPGGGGSYAPLFRAIARSRVATVLKEHGYEYHHLGSWWKGSSRARSADYDYMREEDPWCSGVARVLVQNSVAGRALAALDRAVCGTRERQRRRLEAKLRLLVEIAGRPERTFTFAHLLIPHEPFVFAADGRPLSEADVSGRPWRELYLGQLEYLNRRLLEVVDAIHRRSPIEPIIVIQADEGPFSYSGELAVSPFDWCGAAPDTAYRKFGILSAVSLPGADPPALWPELSPVNTFRLVLRHHFGYDLPPLPDRSFVFPMDGRTYDFMDVTGVLRTVQSRPGPGSLPERLCPDVPEEEIRSGHRGVAVPFPIWRDVDARD